MRQMGTFLLGMLVGAGGLHTAMSYHFVRSANGVHLVPKASPSMKGLYTDVRYFGVNDWREHSDLAGAMVRAHSMHNAGETPLDGFRQKIGGTMGTLLGQRK